MIVIQPDTQLEYELQELYILARHWLQDIYFAEDELSFFSNVITKYQNTISESFLIKRGVFYKKIADQKSNISELKTAIPIFLALLEPYIKDLKTKMDLNLIEEYNGLNSNIQALLHSVQITKMELFTYTETIIDMHQKNSGQPI